MDTTVVLEEEIWPNRSADVLANERRYRNLRDLPRT